MSSIRIVAVGSYLPPLRRNDWWDERTVAGWAASAPPLAIQAARTDGERRVLEAMRGEAHDPFRGTRTRGVMEPSQTSSEMEVAASRAALETAGLAPADVDLLIQQSSANDAVWPQNACRVAAALGLRRDVMTIPMEAGGDSFLLQLTAAQALLGRGARRRGLLVQSSTMASLVDPAAPQAPWFGDAATAVVVERCDDDSGLLASQHHTDGSYFDAYALGAERGPWFRAQTHPRFVVNDRRLMGALMLGIADVVEEVATPALRAVGWERGDVDFFGSHQATSWLSGVLRAHLGLERAGTCDTFADTGSVNACNLPLVLQAAVRSGRLRAGDRALLVCGGAGMTYSAAAVRWA